jgi:TPR repeat protein
MTNHAVAAKWYRKAAEQGHAIAQYNLGRMYEKGWHWLVFLDRYDYKETDYVEAAKWYRMAAEQGNADAQNRLGLMYSDGLGVPEDHAEAVKWYRMAAERGDAIAQYNLGEKYRKGQGVPQDEIMALKWYHMAGDQGQVDAKNMLKKYNKFEENLKKATLGDAKAQYDLGYMYDHGDGVVAENHDEAMKWYLKATAQGEVRTQYQFGFNYNYGHGVPQNIIEALKWYRLDIIAADERRK